jgi:hypothetical protein
VTKDQHYLIVKNLKIGLWSYDLFTRKPCGFIDLTSFSPFNPFGITETFDGKYLYAIVAKQVDLSVPPVLSDEYAKSCEFTLRKYTLPDLKEVEVLKLPRPAVDITAVSFLKGYFLIASDGSFLVYDGKSFKSYDTVKALQYTYAIDEERKRIYLGSQFGMRVLDASMNEVDRADLITDKEVEVNGSLYAYFHMSEQMPEPGLATKTVPQENIQSFDLLGKKYLIVLSTESVQTYSKITVFARDNLTKAGEFVSRSPIMTFSALDGKYIAFQIDDYLNILEVTDD